VRPIDRAARIVEAALREGGRPDAAARSVGTLVEVRGVDIPDTVWRDTMKLVRRACELAEQRLDFEVRACWVLESLSPNPYQWRRA
jgi:hypothetical protein